MSDLPARLVWTEPVADTSQLMGTFTYEPNGTYVFTSNGVTGVAMFLYVLQNAGGLDVATVTIEVTELN